MTVDLVKGSKSHAPSYNKTSLQSRKSDKIPELRRPIAEQLAQPVWLNAIAPHGDVDFTSPSTEWIFAEEA